MATVTESDLPELLPLMRGYCDFYEVSPSDDRLLALARTLIDDPDQGIQLISRDDGGAIGFATIFWTWSTNSAARIGTMNDLFVAPDARGSGAAEALIRACAEHCHQRGAVRVEWETAPDNGRAQAVYDRVGGRREQWYDYWLKA